MPSVTQHFTVWTVSPLLCGKLYGEEWERCMEDERVLSAHNLYWPQVSFRSALASQEGREQALLFCHHLNIVLPEKFIQAFKLHTENFKK